MQHSVADSPSPELHQGTMLTLGRMSSTTSVSRSPSKYEVPADTPTPTLSAKLAKLEVITSQDSHHYNIMQSDNFGLSLLNLVVITLENLSPE